ncbi:hypothetical protein [Gordonia paraffinivorans]|uniref:hypothetical protein n=1 Tax=Gordonia paraffinivorans TaxID=175628 RepID=UPI0014483CBC|nr:hypothetical protein [Gordonia paraffinivorans]
MLTSIELSGRVGSHWKLLTGSPTMITETTLVLPEDSGSRAPLALIPAASTNGLRQGMVSNHALIPHGLRGSEITRIRSLSGRMKSSSHSRSSVAVFSGGSLSGSRSFG